MEAVTVGGGYVLGFNSPDTFALYDDTLYVPSANGVVVRDQNGVSSYWKPTDEMYKVDKLAANHRGVLCLTENRLDVSLHFYHVPSRRKIGEVRNAASVAVQDITFSSTGDVLYVLSSIPTSLVKVYTAQAAGPFVLKETVSLEPLGFSRVLPVTGSDTGFYVWSPHTISFLVSGGADKAVKGEAYAECLHWQSHQLEVSAVLPVANGVLVGTQDGKLGFHELGQESLSANAFATLTRDGASITWIGTVTTAADKADGTYDVTDSLGCVYRCQLDVSSNRTSSSGVPHIGQVQVLGQLCSYIARVEAFCDGAGISYVVGTKRGLFAVNVPAAPPADSVTVSLLCARSGATVRCMTLKTDRFVVVSRNGGVTVSCSSEVEAPGSGHDGSTSVRCHRVACHSPVVDATLLFDRFLIVLCEDDPVVRCLDLIHGVETQPLVLDDFTPIHSSGMDSNGTGRLLLSDEASTHFVTARVVPRVTETSGDEIQFESLGHIDAALSSPLSLVYWLPTLDGRFMATCENGELYLLRYPEEGDATTEHPAESLTENMWRLDFPVVEMFACFVHPDVINLLVHSVDKDTKLYALDRKREADGRVLRPLFMMRDHENGGTVLRRYDVTTVMSAGHDGRVVWRDISHYQSKLSPIPPSKEKRKPSQEKRARHAHDGGITSACLVPTLRALVCGGASDSVVTVVSSDVADGDGPASALTWHDITFHGTVSADDALAGQDPSGGSPTAASHTASAAACASPTRAQTTIDAANALSVRTELAAKMETLKTLWEKAMQEKDEDVPVEALLVPSKQEEFAAACDSAIFDMREREYYNTLMNEYLQDMLRKRCCDSMDVTRVKVCSITRSDLEVHNFQVLKSARSSGQMAKKFQILRRVQKRVGRGRAFTPASQAVESVAADKAASQEISLLWQPTDVYTTCRAVVQLCLLRGLILSEKDDFNRRFNALRERKRSVTSLIHERTSRCVQIRKQLGLHDTSATAAAIEAQGEDALPELFVLHVDREEDPNSLFQVYDDELDEEVRSLIVKDTGARIFSPSNEAAIKQWMDGLEKEVEVLRVHLKPPEFADETRGEGYVPPDERNDEQVRQMEEYERLLKEETEAVSTKREALRHEFRSLQSQNRDAAAALDAEIRQLRTARLAVSERVCHCELQQVEMARRCLMPFSLAQRHSDLQGEKAVLGRRLKSQSALLEQRREIANNILNELEALEESDALFATNVRDAAPFTDPLHGDKLFRRFSRWKHKFDEGKAEQVQREARPEELPEALWELFCRHCDDVAEGRRQIHALEEVHRGHVEVFEKLDAECRRLRDLIEQCDSNTRQLVDGLTRSFLNTRALYQLQQGQVQDEKAVLASEFASSRVRWVTDVLQYNDLILASDAESTQLLEKIVQRERSIKAAQWEAERLRYGVGTLQVELRQLHTLRVTRQMQEWLAGDADASEEKTLARIDEHMAYVEESMSRKAEGLKSVMKQLRHRIAERTTENDIVDNQAQHLRSTVRDQSTVKSMVDSHADGSHRRDQRTKEIYQTSELEELARTQQEELLRLKRDVDRLRERTFPSFAVVSKRTT